jgi:hypothetical protein
MFQIHGVFLSATHPDSLEAYDILASAYDAFGNKERAYRMRERILTLYRGLFGPDHPKTMTALRSLQNDKIDASEGEEVTASQAFFSATSSANGEAAEESPEPDDIHFILRGHSP